MWLASLREYTNANEMILLLLFQSLRSIIEEKEEIEFPQLPTSDAYRNLRTLAIE
jgi:hypothetical protein